MPEVAADAMSEEVREMLKAAELLGARRREMLQALVDERNHYAALLDALYEAAKVDQPDEGKHELAVRIMRMIRPVTEVGR